MESLYQIQLDTIACNRCERLRSHCRMIAATKRRAYRGETYWGQPVPGFGDPKAKLLIVGLAPAAHGGNRTGRVFTGDASGTFLFKGLYGTGFSNLPDSLHRKDGLKLTNTYITAIVHCAPPDNKPLTEEIENCSTFLIREIQALSHVRAVLALGKIATEGYLTTLQEMKRLTQRKSAFPFGHGKQYDLGPNLPKLFCSYHPSRQNTQTGRLTAAMFTRVLLNIQRLLSF